METAYRVILAGNPNVGKSTVFNALTGLKQHTGNWSGKTVDLASGEFKHKSCTFLLKDLPGTYSLISHSPEEEIARDTIVAENPDLILMVADATSLTRNLILLLQILEITPRVALCVNLMDEASRKNIQINLGTLSSSLHIPVLGISAQKRSDIRHLKDFIHTALTEDLNEIAAPLIHYPAPIEDAIYEISSALPQEKTTPSLKRFLSLQLLERNTPQATLLSYFPCSAHFIIEQATIHARQTLSNQGIHEIEIHDLIAENLSARAQDIANSCTHISKTTISTVSFVDKILTSRWLGIPTTLLFFGLLFWLTISGANYPSEFLMSLFLWMKPYFSDLLLRLSLPTPIISLLADGIYQTVTWVTAVMLPPMLIFFPLFTLLEDLGFLPRLAFNLDRCFQRFGSSGKQALTMCMGLGCNAVGVTGCRIISEKRERFSAMITNCFIPCNGRFSLLITLSALFIGTLFSHEYRSLAASFFLLFLITCSIFITLVATGFLTKILFQGSSAPFSLELPPFRKPRVMQILVHSLLNRTLHVLWRALRVSAPAGAIIWLLVNIKVDHTSLLSFFSSFLDPFGKFLGMDGLILLAFLLSMPANEIFLPILLMGYLSSGTMTEPTNLLAIKETLINHGWSTLTAINVMFFSVFHFPCATTLLTIKKESGSLLCTFLGFLFPTIIAILICMISSGCWYAISILFLTKWPSEIPTAILIIKLRNIGFCCRFTSLNKSMGKPEILRISYYFFVFKRG